MWHTSCCISLEVVLDYREFPDWLLFCCLTSCITELAQQTTTHLTNTACSIFYYFLQIDIHDQLNFWGRIWCHGPKGQRGHVPFRENSGTHGNNVYLSLASSSHIGTMLGMATESLLVMINLYYCTLSKHVIERARERVLERARERVRNQQTHC